MAAAAEPSEAEEGLPAIATLSITPRCDKYTAGDEVDVRDVGCLGHMWREAHIMGVGADTVTIRFDGWGAWWDEVLPTDSPRLAPRHTHTRPWRNTLCTGEFVEVRADSILDNTPRWFCARIVGATTDAVALRVEEKDTDIVMLRSNWEFMARSGTHFRDPR